MIKIWLYSFSIGIIITFSSVNVSAKSCSPQNKISSKKMLLSLANEIERGNIKSASKRFSEPSETEEIFNSVSREKLVLFVNALRKAKCTEEINKGYLIYLISFQDKDSSVGIARSKSGKWVIIFW